MPISRLTFTKLLPILLTGLLISGCANNDLNPRSADLIVKYATMKVIEKADDPADKAIRIVAVAEQALEVASTEGVLIAVVQEAVKESIDWASLSPADTLLANELINLVAEDLNDRVDSGVLEGESMLTARRVLEAVIEATELYTLRVG
ncbi:MAG: hypothetical protein NXH95_13640 [Pseudomonadaceae bacterium]|nr:hypothetical protein [Pseudomonadaceae bacterium]